MLEIGKKGLRHWWQFRRFRIGLKEKVWDSFPSLKNSVLLAPRKSIIFMHKIPINCRQWPLSQILSKGWNHLIWIFYYFRQFWKREILSFHRINIFTLSYQVNDNKIFIFEVLKILFALIHKKYKCRIQLNLCSAGKNFRYTTCRFLS